MNNNIMNIDLAPATVDVDIVTTTNNNSNSIENILSNLSSDQKNHVLLLLLQWNSQLVQTAVQQVVYNSDNHPFAAGAAAGATVGPPLNLNLNLNPQHQQQQHFQQHQQHEQHQQHRTLEAVGAAPTATTAAATSSGSGRKRPLPLSASGNSKYNDADDGDDSSTASSNKRPKRRRRTRSTTPKTNSNGFNNNNNNISKSEMWESKLNELRAYKQKYNTAHVPVASKENPQLGRWCDNQRQAYRKYQAGDHKSSWLNEERIQKLNDIGFQWKINPKTNVPLAQRLQQLQEYRDKHGHLKVPLKDPSGLGKWIFDNRRNYQTNKMSKQQYQTLSKVGFPWESPFPKHSLWDDRFERLTQFQKKHGHVSIPDPYPEDQDLCTWVRQIRLAYHQKITLKPEETTTPPAAATTDEEEGKKGEENDDEEEEERQDYQRKTPGRKKSNNGDISSTSTGWKLSDERIASLVRLGFEFGGYQRRFTPWEERYKQLEEFKNEYGHCYPGKVSDGKKKYRELNLWLKRMRSDCKRKALSPDRMEKLVSIGIFQKTRKVGSKVIVLPEEDDNKNGISDDDDDDNGKETNKNAGCNQGKGKDDDEDVEGGNRNAGGEKDKGKDYRGGGGEKNISQK